MIIGRSARVAQSVAALGALTLAGSTSAGPGEILVGGRQGHNVLQFDAAGGEFVKKFVQLGESADPSEMTLGPDGDLFITDAANAAVHRYDGKTGSYKGQFVKAGSGGLASPMSLVFGPDGNLYVTGTPDTTINVYNGQTGAFIKNLLNVGSTVPGEITFGPEDGLIYYVCQTCRNVKVVDPVTGVILRILVQNNQQGPYIARGMAWGPNGNVFLTSGGTNDSIREYHGITGEFIRTFASGGGLDEPYDVVFGAGGVMYVSGSLSSNVAVFDAETGEFLHEAAEPGQGGLADAAGIIEVPSADCYADFTGDGALDLFDFLAYMNAFNAGEEGADCDANGIRDLFDFLCYVNSFNGGCP
jgi:streptogramin lyase